MSKRFKVGDRVQAVKGCSKFYPAGALGTVVEVSHDDYYVDFDAAIGVHAKADGTRNWYVAEVISAPMTCKLSAHKAEYRARANDPATSKGTKRVNKYEQAVLETLAMDAKLSAPTGFTGKDIAAFTELPLNCITPRFAPLRRKGLIKDSGSKRDKQIVWVLA